MISTTLSRALAVVSLSTLGLCQSAGPGDEPRTAIPLLLGTTVEDIGDNVQRPYIHYKVTLSRGQRFTVSIRSTTPNRNLQSTYVGLFAPALRARPSYCFFSSDNRLFQERYSDPGQFTYQVAADGDYYLIAVFTQSGVQYALTVQAEGTPIATSLPQSAGCLAGQVDSITYSLRLIGSGLPDEVVIGGTRACDGCAVKPPRYVEIAARIENALRSRVNVEACHDSSGNIFQIKMSQ